jgi:hypothetical protein
LSSVSQKVPNEKNRELERFDLEQYRVREGALGITQRLEDEDDHDISPLINQLFSDDSYCKSFS